MASILSGIMLVDIHAFGVLNKNDQFNDKNPLLKRNSLQHRRMLKILENKYRGDSQKHSKDCQGIANLPVFNKYLMDFMEILIIPELNILLGLDKNYTTVFL